MSSRVCCKLEVIVQVGNTCGYRLNTSKIQNLMCASSRRRLSSCPRSMNSSSLLNKKVLLSTYLASFPGCPFLFFGLCSVNHGELKSGDCVDAKWRTHNGRSLGMRLLPTVMYKYMRMSNATKNLCNVY